MPSSYKKHKSFAITNICLLQLLVKGILKMNISNYYHYDIKGSNIMRTISPTIHSTDGVKTRLIDWGLAFKYKKNDLLPNEILDRPLPVSYTHLTLPTILLV